MATCPIEAKRVTVITANLTLRPFVKLINFRELFFFVVGKKWILKKLRERKLSVKEHAL